MESLQAKTAVLLVLLAVVVCVPVPSAPSDVTVSDRTTTSVTLTVTPGPGGYDGYRVQTVGDGINRNETFLHNTAGDRLLVSGLTPGTTFTFTVFTLANGLESTDFYRTQDSTSDKVKRSDNPIADEPTEEPAAPNNVEVKSQTNMSVTLTVTPPDSGYDGFLVEYKNLNQTFDDITVDGVTSGSHSLIVNNLTPGTTYTFDVYTLYNDLTSTNSTGNTGSTVPNPPGNVAVTTQTNSTVTLAITLPSTGGVDNYSVTFTDRHGTKETRNTTNNHSSYTVDTLISGYNYTFVVVSVYKGLSSTPYQDVPASTVPAVPTIDKSSTTEDSIIVTLTSPAPGFVDHYNVSKGCASSNSISPAVTVSGQTVTISGLNSGTTCNLAVIAVFHGLYSSVAIFSGLNVGEAIPGKVEDLAAQILSATAVRLTWKKPTNPNGDIIQYSVYVTDPEGTCVQHVQITKVGGTALQDLDTCKETRRDTFVNNQSEFNQTINDLLAYTHYTFRVFAYTVAGRGLESSQTSNTSQSEPHKITDLTSNSTSSSTITGSFNEPRPSTGPITTYEVQYIYMERVCDKGLGTVLTMINHTNCTPSSGRTVCSIDNLYSYWDYSISVRAYTSIGPGNWSDSLLQRTRQDKPSSIDPDSTKPSVITANSVTLEWSAPCPPNGVITNYVILGQWNMSSPIITPDNSTSYLVPGLLKYRYYTYQIAAETVAGKGNYTTGKSFTTLVDDNCSPVRPPANEEDHGVSAAVPVLGALLALSIIVNLMTVVFLIRYRRSKVERKAAVDNGYEVPESLYDQLDPSTRQPENIYDTTPSM